MSKYEAEDRINELTADRDALKEELSQSRAGCWACESVAIENAKLCADLQIAVELLKKARRNWCSTTSNWQLQVDEYFLTKAHNEAKIQGGSE